MVCPGPGEGSSGASYSVNEAEVRLAAIVESSEDAIISEDLSGIIQSWNSGAVAMFGYTAEEAVGSHDAMLADPERLHEDPDVLACIRRAESVHHHRARHRARDGRILTVSLTASPIRDASGHVVGALKILRDLTTQARADELQQRLAAIVESSDDAIVSKDLNGIIQSWNRGAQRIFGYTPEETIGRHISMLAVPERVEEIPNILERIRRGERIDHYETRRRAKDGRVLAISLTVSPIRDSFGNVIGASKVARDVTDQNRYSEWRERLAAIVESSDDAIISKDLDGTIRSWNRGAERIFGYTAEEVVGKPVTMLAVPERVEEIPNILERIRRGERVDHYETRRRTKDGRVLAISLTVSPIRDSSGTIIGASKVARDITHQKQAQEERERLLARQIELRETAELLNQIGPALAAELDLGRLTHNLIDVATRLTGARFGVLYDATAGGSTSDGAIQAFSNMTSDAFQRLAIAQDPTLLQHTLRGERALRSDDLTDDSRFGLRDDTVKSYLAMPVISRSGEVLAGMFFGHPETARFTEWHERVVAGIAAQAAIALDNARLFLEVTKSRESLEQSNEELRRANADLEQFAFSASHDLKEPLRMVALYSQILQRRFGEKLEPEAREYFGYVIDGAKRMDKLVQDLLAYTRSAVLLRSDVPVTTIASSSVLEQAKGNLAPVIQESGAVIEHGPLPRLAITEVHLLQVFQNLIENAIKYRSEEPPRIRVDAERDGDLWRISINDNGIGIAPEYADQVFGIFKRLHTSEKYSGTGIGLAICQRIVNRYGGRIWVDSAGEGRGSTFRFTLPGDGDAAAQ